MDDDIFRDICVELTSIYKLREISPEFATAVEDTVNNLAEIILLSRDEQPERFTQRRPLSISKKLLGGMMLNVRNALETVAARNNISFSDINLQRTVEDCLRNSKTILPKFER